MVFAASYPPTALWHTLADGGPLCIQHTGARRLPHTHCLCVSKLIKQFVQASSPTKWRSNVLMYLPNLLVQCPLLLDKLSDCVALQLFRRSEGHARFARRRSFIFPIDPMSWCISRIYCFYSVLLFTTNNSIGGEKLHVPIIGCEKLRWFCLRPNVLMYLPDTLILFTTYNTLGGEKLHWDPMSWCISTIYYFYRLLLFTTNNSIGGEKLHAPRTFFLLYCFFLFIPMSWCNSVKSCIWDPMSWFVFFRWKNCTV